MKKILISGLGAVMALSFFTGCATDGIYNVGKVSVQGAKKIAEETGYKNEKLRKAYEVAKTYDKARTAVRGQLDQLGNDQDADITSVQEH